MSDDGGSAFPQVQSTFSQVRECIVDIETAGGMSLRDYFATAALQGLLSSKRNGQPGVWYDPPASQGLNETPYEWAFVPESNAESWGSAAYRLADAMLKARAK